MSFSIGDHMNAELVEEKPKTKVWKITSKHHGTTLGFVKWYPRWRQYCFFINELVFSSGCFRDIDYFQTFQNAVHKAERKKWKMEEDES